MINEKWRNEVKYQLTEGQVILLKSRIRGFMELDTHVDNIGQYHIRSLYFDDFNNSCYHENASGTDPREKFRIRMYNNDTANIKLELKRKRQGLNNKKSCRLSLEQCQTLIDGKIPVFENGQPELLSKLCMLMQTKLFRPVAIVDYFRIPYVLATGNVRVTFDLDIASSNHVSGFLNKEIPRWLILPVGQHIMEVKWDGFLPDHIKQLLQSEGLNKEAFSKYCQCRRVNLMGRVI